MKEDWAVIGQKVDGVGDFFGLPHAAIDGFAGQVFQALEDIAADRRGRAQGRRAAWAYPPRQAGWR
jgi:hypothetical protein